MRRLATVLLLVVALAAASTALAQAQRWEYASLEILGGSGAVVYIDSRTLLSSAVLGGPTRIELGDTLSQMFGQPADLLLGGGGSYTDNNLLNILGYGGWEIVAILTDAAGGRIYFFKRPLQ
jgi:hypothetical protein